MSHGHKQDCMMLSIAERPHCTCGFEGERMKKYQIIYADPPWRYKFANGYKRAIENHYPTMALEEIKNLNVPCEKEAMLFLWATAPKLDDALQVVTAWGFTYTSHLIWDKELMGCGNWVRIQHELLLFGRKGKLHCPPIPERIRSIYKEKRTKHSKKPQFLRDWIGRCYPEYTKLEMFARNDMPLLGKIPGWDVWGNEVNSDIEL